MKNIIYFIDSIYKFKPSLIFLNMYDIYDDNNSRLKINQIDLRLYEKKIT